jgi:hypothetical protein
MVEQDLLEIGKRLVPISTLAEAQAPAATAPASSRVQQFVRQRTLDMEVRFRLRAMPG